MLTKDFTPPASADALTATRFERVMTNLHAPEMSDREKQDLVARVFGASPPATQGDLTTVWRQRRHQMLHLKQEALNNLGLTMADIRAYALETYMKPENAIRDIYGIDSHTKLETAVSGILKTARDNFNDLRNDAIASDPAMMKMYERSMARNENLANAPYRHQKTGDTYFSLMTRFETEWTSAQAAAIRLAELDLAYKISCATPPVSAGNMTLHAADLRNIQYAHLVKTFRPQGKYPSHEFLAARGRVTGQVYH